MHIDLVGDHVLGQGVEEDLRGGGELLVREFSSQVDEHLGVHGQPKHKIVTLGNGTAQSGFMLGHTVGFNDVAFHRQLGIGSFDTAGGGVNEGAVAQWIGGDQSAGELGGFGRGRGCRCAGRENHS